MMTAAPPPSNDACTRSGTRSLWPVSLTQTGIDTALGHCSDHGRGARRIELGRDSALLGFAGVRRSDIQFERTQAGLIDQPRHLDGSVQIGHDDAWDRVGVLQPRFAIERDRLLQPLVEGNPRQS